jgi:predicted TIM-barrel fold metal-dependent hydrolase
MTSAWAPRHLPASLLHYMRTRGKDKIMFASDSPVLSISRTVKEATELDLPDEVLDNYLFGNSEAFFFSRFGS